jgi:hypothetical protein
MDELGCRKEFLGLFVSLSSRVGLLSMRFPRELVWLKPRVVAVAIVGWTSFFALSRPCHFEVHLQRDISFLWYSRPVSC